MKIVDKIKARKNHKAILAVMFAFVYMMTINAPLIVYLSNSREFWFDLKILAPIILSCFAFGFIVSYLFVEILNTFLNERLFFAFYIIVFCSFIGLYIQGNFIPRNYGVLDGRKIDWSAFPGYAIASAVLWLSIIAIAVALLILIRDEKKREKFYQISAYISGAVFIMLTVAVISLIPKADKLVSEHFMILGGENEFTYSEQKNILVLCLDSFDADLMDQMLNENEEKYSEILEDFTYYKNSVGRYPITACSVPKILTGQSYTKDMDFDSFLAKVYSESQLFKVLNDNGYITRIFAPKEFDYSVMPTQDYVEGKYIINPIYYRAFVVNLYKLVLFDYAPHQLKKNYVVYTGDFDAWSETDGKMKMLEKMPEYYRYLTANGIDVTGDTPVFMYLHLEGAHTPATFDENLRESSSMGYECIDEAKGSMTAVDSLIKEFKEKGIYDNSAIVILSDHGCRSCGNKMGSRPLLLFKDFNEKHELRYSNNAVSWDDLMPTFCSLVTGNDDPDAIWNQTDESRVRIYSWLEGTWRTNGGIIDYNVYGDVSTGNERYEIIE